MSQKEHQRQATPQKDRHKTRRATAGLLQKRAHVSIIRDIFNIRYRVCVDYNVTTITFISNVEQKHTGQQDQQSTAPDKVHHGNGSLNTDDTDSISENNEQQGK